jgi:hypothetical protein
MIQKICIADAKPARYRARSFISRAVNQTPDACLYQSARTHRTRLNRRVNVDAREPVISQLPRGLAKSNDFSVGCGIAVSTRAVSGNSDEFIFTDNAGADGHLAICLRLARSGQRQPHPLLVKLYFRGAHLQTTKRTVNIGQKEGFTQRRTETH